jgi:hypothetical protein
MGLKGLGDLSKKLDQLAENARELGNTSSASLTDILTPDFVSRHTRFANADEFFLASGFDVSSQSAFEAIPQGGLDSFVQSASPFSCWQEMLNAAGAEWAKRKLGL